LIEGESRLENLEVLRHKESDRIEEILKLLATFQVEHTLIFSRQRSSHGNDCLLIHAGK
jgi:5-enolpyruvylshikimate-3-phosphate synthase